MNTAISYLPRLSTPYIVKLYILSMVVIIGDAISKIQNCTPVQNIIGLLALGFLYPNTGQA
jgi:hypothetical protein